MDKITVGLDTWYHERIVQQSVQRAKDALTATCYAATMGARDTNPMAGVALLFEGIFHRLEVGGSVGFLHPSRLVELMQLKSMV